MARARNIKHGLYLNEVLAELSIYARYLFPCLWCLADKHGRMEYRPKKIKAEAYPYDDVDVPALLLELHEKKFISVYGHGTRAYIQVHNWEKHQNPHPKEKSSEIPDINDPLSIVATIGNNEHHEKQFNFVESNGGAAKGNGEAEKFNLIPDVRIPDSIPSSPAGSDAKPERMTRKEFVALYQQTFGQMMPGGLNCDSEKICAKYLPDKIKDAFSIAASNNATSFSYVKAVLEDRGNGKQERTARRREDFNDDLTEEFLSHGTGRV